MQKIRAMLIRILMQLYFSFCQGPAVHVPDLHVVVQSLALVHHVELVTVARDHHENKIAVLGPEVHVVKDLTQGLVQNLVQDPDSLVPSLILVQDHPRIKYPGLLLGLPDREGPQLLIALLEIVMMMSAGLCNATKKMLTMIE